MVVGKAVENLKDRPKDERQVVAITGAGAVVLILIVVWAFYFVQSLKKDQTVSDRVYDIPVDTGAIQVQQTYQAYNTGPQKDQFGLPAQQ
jgi:hypothetical protein